MVDGCSAVLQLYERDIEAFHGVFFPLDLCFLFLLFYCLSCSSLFMYSFPIMVFCWLSASFGISFFTIIDFFERINFHINIPISI